MENWSSSCRRSAGGERTFVADSRTDIIIDVGGARRPGGASISFEARFNAYLVMASESGVPPMITKAAAVRAAALEALAASSAT